MPEEKSLGCVKFRHFEIWAKSATQAEGFRPLTIHQGSGMLLPNLSRKVESGCAPFMAI